MITKLLKTALEAQIQEEFAAAKIYLNAAVSLGVTGFPGMEHWYWKQYEEELEHAHKLIHYMVDRDEKPHLLPIPEPITSYRSNLWDNPLNVAVYALSAERNMSIQLENLYELAMKERDFKTVAMLQWFLEEQVEEEKLFTDLVDATRRVDGDGPGLEYLDREMGKR